ncbi:MAG TPA: winged helix-turn-helix domain-containing protein, partial [Rheinheimera sp.]|nr:winged helix-turn-helix domain-containing protein [Rheinheimera sp.]
MNGGQTPALIWCLGNVEFDATAHTVQAKGDDAVLLDRNCAAVLLALLQAGGSPVDKDTLLTTGWPGRVVHENSLAKAISRLRQALADEGQRIEAVYGRGYQLTGVVHCKTRTQPSLVQDRPFEKLSRFLSPPFVTANKVWLAAGILLLGTSILLTVSAVIWGKTALQQADAQWQRHEALLSFVSSDLLASTDPYATSAQQHALHDTVLQVAEQLDKRFAQDPATQLTFHRMLARAFSGWGQYEKAAAHLEQAARLVVAEQGDNAKQESILIDIALCQNLRLGGETRRAEPVCLRAEQNARHTGSAHLAQAGIGRAKLQFEIGQYDAAASALAGVLQSSGLLSPAEQADAQWFYGL